MRDLLLPSDWHRVFDEVKLRGQFDSDAQLAEYLGLTRAQISAWRTGKSALGTLVRLKLLDALGYDSLRSALQSLYPTQDCDEQARRQARLVERVAQTAPSPRVVPICGTQANPCMGVPWSGNVLLAALPDDERTWLAPHLDCISLRFGDRLDDRNAGPADVYFPTTAVVSVILLAEAGRSAEMVIVGHDGLIGPSLFPGAAVVPVRSVVQCDGQAMRLAESTLKDALACCAVLRRRFFGYTQNFTAQVAQTTECHVHHSTLQRLCRWLLLSADRSSLMNPLPAREGWLARQLGVPEASVRNALGMLVACGAIACAPAGIQILNRATVEQRACDCYGVRREAPPA
ncbi:hypothetical protein [Burkholderia ubonensis]|uniref:hypothetical protein n=1 Tax=Burkholderia ubonensis TaxID=101571 RepID=UPI000756F5E0|nr:hypothetical protein [Burkholderia ubonensis]KVW59625.1 hypothetical protein WK99_18280 [Burkholderia ubonensis]